MTTRFTCSIERCDIPGGAGAVGGQFEDSDRGKSLVDDYAVPPYFKQDLFGVIGDSDRPPWRWVVMGPARSGSAVHTGGSRYRPAC